MIWTVPKRLRIGGVGGAYRVRAWTPTDILTRWHSWHGALTGASSLDETPPSSGGQATSSQGRHAEAHEATFEQFFHKYEEAIFGYLWRITGDEQTSYDIAQETFLRAWQHFEQVSHYEQPRAWLFRVATNLASNHRRHRSIHSATMTTIGAPQTSATDPATGVAESATVRAALMALPIRQRSALALRAVYGLSIAEIAEALGVSKAAAAMTLSRARDAFRARYTEEETR
jgi:RNA polymerase sigma-70 factor, ECF subfamily